MTDSLAEDLTQVIFEKDDWAIQQINREKYVYLNLDSIIVHRCTNVHSTDRKWSPSTMLILERSGLKNRCLYCNSNAPEAIQALWLLQNMDVL